MRPWLAPPLAFVLATACTAPNPAFYPSLGGAGSGGRNGSGGSGGTVRPDGGADEPRPDVPAAESAPPVDATATEPAAEVSVSPMDVANEAAPLPARRLSLSLSPSTGTKGEPGMAAAAAEDCPNGDLVVGFEVDYDSDPVTPMVQAIAAVCGRVSVTAGASYAIGVASKSMMGPRGSNGPSMGRLECGKDQVVVGFFGGAGGLLDQLGLNCAPLSSGDGRAVTPGPSARVGPLPTVTSGTRYDESCSGGGVVTGYQVNYGSWIDALALRCARATLVP